MPQHAPALARGEGLIEGGSAGKAISEAEVGSESACQRASEVREGGTWSHITRAGVAQEPKHLTDSTYISRN